MRSNIYEFTVLDEISDEVKTSKESSLNMIINLVEEKELICDIAKTNDSIIVSLCLDHDEMADVYGYRTSSEVDELKSSLLEPIVLFSLFLHISSYFSQILYSLGFRKQILLLIQQLLG